MPKSLRKFIKALTYYAVYMMGLLLLLYLVGCSPKTIYVPEVHYEYITRTDTFVRIDSVSVKDSIYVTQKGDTVRIERWHVQYRDRWREKIVRDTIMRSDTISVPYPVEKKITLRQKFDMYLECMSVCIFVMIVALLLYLIVRWRKGRILVS